MRLQGRTILVTGGASGIGAAAASRLAAEGARVIIADLAVADGLDKTPATIRLDVADEADVARCFALIARLPGPLTGLFHAAGVGRDIGFLETTAAEFDRIVAINLRGTFLVGQAAARAMAACGGGAIVNVASVAGMRGSIGRAAYGASKGGVVILSQVMAVDLAPHGIRVNVIAPGPIDTPLVAAMHDPAIREAWMRVTPQARYGAPAEVAAAASFLLSDDASFVTGHVMAVDGGLLGAGLCRR